MRHYLRAIVIACLVAYGVPSVAHAQFSFDGLDSGKSKKKKKKKKRRSSRSGDKARDNDDDDADDKPATASPTEAPLPPGGLDLSAPPPGADSAPPVPAAPAPAAERRRESKPAPTMTFDAIDVSGKSAERQRLELALSKFKQEQYETAALMAYELMQDPKMAGLHLDSQYLLAKTLYRMGMYHSALDQFSKILAKGPNTKFFKTSLEWLFFISHKTLNEGVILDEIAKYSNFQFPEKFRNEFYYLLARYHFMRGKALDELEQKLEANKSFDEVRRLTLMVPKGTAYYPKAKYLEAMAYFRDNKLEAAVESLKEVVRRTRRPPGPLTSDLKSNQSLRELAFMQLARTHYGARQNRNALYYFGKIERGTDQWLESLFEASWANYRIGQYEQALGNLITLSSPFFRDEYFPEALILKAVIYYENCRYRESTTILEDFERIYGPVQQQLQMLVDKQMDSTEYYTVLSEIQKKNKSGLEKNTTDIVLERVLNLALTDTDLKRVNDSILELEREIDSIAERGDTFKYSDLSKTVIEALKLQREELIKKAGIMAKGKLEFELGQLKQFIANALRIRFETTSKEKEFLEEQLKQGGRTEIVRKYKYSVAVADDQLYWPYEGEYWRDELGTYHYTLTKGCIDPGSNRAEGL